jgi:hypothetical protein
LDKEKTFEEKFPREGGEGGHRYGSFKRDESSEEILGNNQKKEVHE